MFPAYSLVLNHCANNGCKDLDESQKPKPCDRVENYKKNLKIIAQGPNWTTPWDRWVRLNHQEREWQDYELQRPKKYRLQWEEIFFVSQLALHLCDESPAIRVPWPFIENLSITPIDDSVLVKHLVQNNVPNTLWIEWDIVTGYPANKPWLSKCIGLLISRMVVLDEPSRISGIQTRPQNKRTFIEELVTALMQTAQEEIPCAGYMMVIAQKVNSNINFVPFVFGEDQSASVNSMIDVHAEFIDKDKRPGKDVAKYFSEIGIRFLLLSQIRNWFPTGKGQVEISATQLPESRSGPQKFTNYRNKISLRPVH